MPRCDREVQHTLFRCEIVTEHAYFTLSRGCYDTIDDLPDPEAFPKLGDIRNVVSQEAWRMAKAMVLADRGEFTEAERLGREVVDLAMGGDALDDQGSLRTGPGPGGGRAIRGSGRAAPGSDRQVRAKGERRLCGWGPQAPRGAHRGN
jgi:hypothetical protein